MLKPSIHDYGILPPIYTIWNRSTMLFEQHYQIGLHTSGLIEIDIYRCMGLFFTKIFILNTPSRSKYLSPLIFSSNFDHLSYSKNYASIIYYAGYMLYYCTYFKFDLSFYIFVIIFWIRRMVKVVKKWWIFRYGGSIWFQTDPWK
jgi:hypothetical protein